MKNPPQTAGYQQKAKRGCLKDVTPNVLIGGPVPDSPGFPMKHSGMRASKRSGKSFLRRLRGIKPAVMKKEQLHCGRLEPFERLNRLNCSSKLQEVIHVS